MKTQNIYFRKGILREDLHMFFRPLEKEDTPSCEICGGPLHSADEVFSEECDACFTAFLELAIESQEEEKDH